MTLQLNESLRSVLCIGAHADDIEIGCGATLAALLAAKPDLIIHWSVFSADQQRAEEARRSAELYLSETKSHHIDIQMFRDSFFPSQYAPIKEHMHSIANVMNPDLIFTHRLEDRHQDHRLLSELTHSVFRGPLILEYEIPKFDGDLLPINLVAPCSREDCEQKIKRLFDCFESQTKRTWFDEEVFQSQMRMRGIEGGSGTTYAEAFYLRKTILEIPCR